MQRLLLLLALAVLTLPASAMAAPAVSVDPAARVVPINPHLELLVDETGSLSLEELLSEPTSSAFEASDRHIPYRGFGADRIWVRFALSNPGSRPLVRTVALDYPPMKLVRFHWRGADGSWSRQTRGWRAAAEDRKDAWQIATAEVELAPAETLEFLVSVDATTPVTLDFKVFDPVHLASRQTALRFGYDVYGLVALLLALYHLGMFAIRRTRAWLFLAPFGLAVSSVYWTSTNNLAMFLPDAWGFLCEYLHPLSAALIAFFGALFTRDLVSASTLFPRLDAALKVVAGLSLLPVALIPFQPALAMHWASVLTTVSVPLFCAVPGWASLKGQRSARLFAIGMLLFLASSSPAVLVVWGVLDPTPLTGGITALGYVAIALTATLALAIKTGHTERRVQAELEAHNWTLATAREDERRRIAEDLHDGVIQMITGAQLQLAHLRANARRGLTSGEFDAGFDSLARAHDMARRVMSDLSPPVLANLGLKAAVEEIEREMRVQYRLETTLRFEGDEDWLDEAESQLVYRLLRELLMNVAKHAQASKVAVTLLLETHRALLSVQDDGVGFDPDTLRESVSSTSGLGLLGARNQVERLGGRFRIRSTPGGGTEIRVSLPLPGTRDDWRFET